MIWLWMWLVYLAMCFVNGMIAIEKNKAMPIFVVVLSLVFTPLVVWMYLVAVPDRK